MWLGRQGWWHLNHKADVLSHFDGWFKKMPVVWISSRCRYFASHNQVSSYAIRILQVCLVLSFSEYIIVSHLTLHHLTHIEIHWQNFTLWGGVWTVKEGNFRARAPKMFWKIDTVHVRKGLTTLVWGCPPLSDCSPKEPFFKILNNTGRSSLLHEYSLSGKSTVHVW